MLKNKDFSAAVQGEQAPPKEGAPQQKEVEWPEGGGDNSNLFSNCKKSLLQPR
jgi:hypothetical protein